MSWSYSIKSVYVPSLLLFTEAYPTIFGGISFENTKMFSNNPNFNPPLLLSFRIHRMTTCSNLVINQQMQIQKLRFIPQL